MHVVAAGVPAGAQQVGQGLVGNGDFYTTISGKKPVYTAAPSGLDDFISTVSVSYFAGALGASLGIVAFSEAQQSEIESALGRLAQAKAPVVFSSSLETAVGMQSALRAAFAWEGTHPSEKPCALGFGVAPLFADARCDGPVAAPFLYREDVERLRAHPHQEATKHGFRQYWEEYPRKGYVPKL